MAHFVPVKKLQCIKDSNLRFYSEAAMSQRHKPPMDGALESCQYTFFGVVNAEVKIPF